MKVIVNNLAIEYQDQGVGPVVLMLHGWQDSLKTFDQIVPTLAGTHRVVRIDLPGFGQSETPTGTWTLDDYVQLVADFVTKLQLDVAVIVGHSMGGRIAIKGVATGKLSPRKLILIAAAGISTSHSLRSRLFKGIAKIGKLVTLVPPLYFYRNQLRAKLYAMAGSDYLGAGKLQQTYLNIIGEDLTESAAKITIPTLLVWGDDDGATPLADGQRFATIIPNSKLEVLSGGHFIHREQPENVATRILSFL